MNSPFKLFELGAIPCSLLQGHSFRFSIEPKAKTDLQELAIPNL